VNFTKFQEAFDPEPNVLIQLAALARMDKSFMLKTNALDEIIANRYCSQRAIAK